MSAADRREPLSCIADWRVPSSCAADRHGPLSYIMASEAHLDALAALMAETVAGIRDSELFVADDRESLAWHIHKEGRILMAVDEKSCLAPPSDNDFQPRSGVPGTTPASWLAAFLMVRFPGNAADNLGVYAGLMGAQLDRVAHMESVTVRDTFRGYGLQKALVDRGENLARQLGYAYSMCTISPKNPWSLANMEAAGYAIVATVPKYGGRMRHILFKCLE